MNTLCLLAVLCSSGLASAAPDSSASKRKKTDAAKNTDAPTQAPNDGTKEEPGEAEDGVDEEPSAEGEASPPEPEPESAPAVEGERAEGRAKVRGAEGKRLRIYGDTELAGFVHTNPDGNNDNTNGGGFGIGRTSLIDGSVVGGGALHFRPLWTVGAGAVFFDSRVAAGARLGFAVDAWRDDDSGEEGAEDDPRQVRTSGTFVLDIRWLFRPGKRVRPYAGLHMGVGGGASGTRSETTEARSRLSTVWPVVGLDGGAHIFIIDAFSLDVGVVFDYFALHERTVDTDEDGDTTTDDWEKSADIVSLGARVGLSLWF